VGKMEMGTRRRTLLFYRGGYETKNGEETKEKLFPKKPFFFLLLDDG